MVNKLINQIIPTYFKSENMFDVKMSLNIADDLIEDIGQDMLGNETWNFMYEIITKLVTDKDATKRRAASYGIGNFAEFTTNNFDNYAQGLINALYNAMNVKDKIIDSLRNVFFKSTEVNSGKTLFHIWY